jgi:hypothetical protein
MWKLTLAYSSLKFIIITILFSLLLCFSTFPFENNLMMLFNVKSMFWSYHWMGQFWMVACNLLIKTKNKKLKWFWKFTITKSKAKKEKKIQILYIWFSLHNQTYI